MADCLSCAELEQKICDLAEEIANASCSAYIIKEGDTTEDRTPGLKAKVDILKVYKELYQSKGCGSEGELFEFVSVPCVTPATCTGASCRTLPSIRNQRRYRR